MSHPHKHFFSDFTNYFRILGSSFVLSLNWLTFQEVKQIAGLDTCGDSVRNEICCWLRLKNSYERIVLPLQDEYMYLTVQEVKTVDTELYEVRKQDKICIS